MKTVLVFKTSVGGNSEVRLLTPVLDQLIQPSGRWNFDLEDCDNILRVETQRLAAHAVVTTLAKRGFRCEEL